MTPVAKAKPLPYGWPACRCRFEAAPCAACATLAAVAESVALARLLSREVDHAR